MSRTKRHEYLTDAELAAWRGCLEFTYTAIGALDGALSAAHGISIKEYDVLITLYNAPGARLRMADLVGPEHVAFGTDMEGAGPGPILSNYVDLRDVADNLVRRGIPEAVLHGIFIGNYARIVRRAMEQAA